MKKCIQAAFFFAGISLILVGAGCSSKGGSQAQAAPNSQKQPFVERRTAEPPTPPAKIPPPTPVSGK
ncbi:MAG: hypothetical protein WC477_05455 [Patescibacteria group bacterium]